MSVATSLGVAGWIAGLATGSAATALIVTARMRSDQPTMLPADWVTLTRAVLCAGVAGLVAASFGRPVSITALVTLSAVALSLDAVDGQVARRTGTATSLGARFDGEVDAFLILLLSIVVSQAYGSWVLAIGAARYALLLAGWLIPWLAAPLPPRYWRKVVAAVQGIVLTIAASGLLDRLTGTIAVAVALLLLAESFGRDVIWLYRAGAGPRSRLALRLATAVLAIALVWSDLLAPDRAWQFTPAAFARIPVEGLVLVAVALVLPRWPRRIVAAVAGILLGVLTFAKILNIAFYEYQDRAFNPVFDWGSIGPALGAVRDVLGSESADIVLGALGFGLILLTCAIIAATIHITTVAARHRRGAFRGLAGLTAVWAVCAALSLQLIPGFPVASTSATGVAVAQVRATQAAFQDQRLFEQAIHSPDPEASIPASDLLTGLRGKDVVIAFVEAYGDVAIRGTSFSAGIDASLRQDNASLASAGWSTRSAWVTAPSYGGASQLAHSTLQAGVWVNSLQRYAQLIGTSRFTLSDAFDKAGWRTVSDSPSDGPSWPAGTSFYHFDQLLNRHNVGYQGPTFGYASMPDQYVLTEFQRLELAPRHKPVMAEIDLVSSHWAWTPLPTMVPWNKVGDGSIFDPMAVKRGSLRAIEANASLERQLYSRSIQYSMQALTSWVTEANDPNLVVILLGDEQPDTPISTPGRTSHELPISIIARDPSVFRQIDSWRWQDGLVPGNSAPDELMSAFRNQFLGAFSTASPKGALAQGPAAPGTATASGSLGGPVSQGRWLVSLTRLTMAAAAAVIAANFFALAYGHDQVWQYAVTNFIWGAGFAFAYSAAAAAYLHDATPAEAAMYSSANAVISTGISGLGAAIFIAVLAAAPTIAHTPIPQPGVFTHMWIYAGIAGVMMLALTTIVRRPRSVPADQPADPVDPFARLPE
ncbi:MAG TPA: CDP-alcohol phosphatidyltransferase family protein [Trebonia sp.]